MATMIRSLNSRLQAGDSSRRFRVRLPVMVQHDKGMPTTGL